MGENIPEFDEKQFIQTKIQSRINIYTQSMDKVFKDKDKREKS